MKQFLILFTLILLVLAVFTPQPIYAATSSPCQFAGKDKGLCESCMGSGGSTKEAVWTAFGCLETDSGLFATRLIQFGSGLAGGIAFLLIVLGGFQIIMSAGNPEKLNEGKELVTSAVVGLLFIIFSVFLLRMIGVDILGIPGFE